MKDTCINRILFALLFVLLVPSLVSATTYYVDMGGTNNGSCGTTSGTGACATLSYLVGNRHLGSKGDDIQIAVGSYTDNTQVVLPVGVHVHGAGSATTTIKTNVTTAGGYIKAQSPVPVVDGSNEISGFNLIASSTNKTGITSSGRNNQKIHDMIFTNWTSEAGDDAGAIWIGGKYGRDDLASGFWVQTCSGGEGTCSYCGSNTASNISPLSTDWATGVDIYNNTFTNSELKMNVLKGAKIHDNTINNDTGTNLSGIGHTGFWFSGIKIYNNTINMNSISNTVIAVELWAIGEGSKIYNNIISGWTSFGHHGLGKGSNVYALEIYGNTFYVAKAMSSTANPTIEIVNTFSDVAIYNNYFASSATDRGCTWALAIWGPNIKRNILIYGNIFGLQYYDGSNKRVITLEDQNSTTYTSEVYVYNNVFDVGSSKRAGGIMSSSGGVITNTYWRNNIFNNMDGNLVLNAGSSWTGHTAENNYSFNCVNNYVSSGDAKWTLADNVTTNSIAPGFVGTGNKPSPYYLLQTNSPCIAAGVALGTPYNIDPAGNERVRSDMTAWDIGAYTYISILTPPKDLKVK